MIFSPLQFCYCSININTYLFFYFNFVFLVTGPLTELQIAFMCRETLKGLSYLHTVGKMHRDIKVTTIIIIISEINLFNTLRYSYIEALRFLLCLTYRLLIILWLCI